MHIEPLDLAARIRAMIYAWTDAWLLAEGDDAAIVYVILGELRSAYANAYQGFSASAHVDFLRKRARGTRGHQSWSALYSRAASELEVIEREFREEQIAESDQ